MGKRSRGAQSLLLLAAAFCCCGLAAGVADLKPPAPQPPPPPAQGVVVFVRYKQEGGTPARDNATLISFVWRLTGGIGEPVLPKSTITWLSSAPISPRISQPLVVDTGCTAASGAWVEAVVRVNTPYAFAVHKNVTDSLQGPGSGRLATRWQITMGNAMAAQNRSAPCFGANYSSLQYTAASTPPPAPPSPRPPKPPSPRPPPPHPKPPSPKPPNPRPPPPLPSPHPPPPSPPSPNPPPPPPPSPSPPPPFPPPPSPSPPPPSPPSPEPSPPPSPKPPSPPKPPAKRPPPLTPAPAPAPEPAVAPAPADKASPPPPSPSPPTPALPSPSPEFQSPSPEPEPSEPENVPSPSPSPDVPSPSPAEPSPEPSPAEPSPEPSLYLSPEPSPYLSPALPDSPYVNPNSPYVAPQPYSPYVPATVPYTPSPDPAYLSPDLTSPAPGPQGDQVYAAYGPGGQLAGGPDSAPAPAPGPAASSIPTCDAEPECKMFVAYAKCCQGGGILAAGSSLRMWLVCNRDVYLPAPKCLTVKQSYSGEALPAAVPTKPDLLNTVAVRVVDTPNARGRELLVGLPLAYYVAPISVTPGRLAIVLDLEDARMKAQDGMCSLRLRKPCEWEGTVYDAVTAVEPVPVKSVLPANATEAAEALVADAVKAANQQAAQDAAIFGDGNYTDSSGAVVDAGPVNVVGAQTLVTGSVSSSSSSIDAGRQAGGSRRLLAAAANAAFNMRGFVAARLGGGRQLRQKVVSAQDPQGTVGGDLPIPRVNETLLPPLVDVLAPANYASDVMTDDFFISWLPSNTTAGEVCSMVNSADLPEDFLQGDIAPSSLNGYEEVPEDCLVDGLDFGPTDQELRLGTPPGPDVPNSGA